MVAKNLRNRGGESGQAAVESAITLPLVIFLVLGSLQLFLMLNARIMTQYAAFKATRAGSVSQGNCGRMMHAAIAALLPTVTRTDSAGALGTAFSKFEGNDYGGLDGLNGKMIWLIREQPTNVPAPEDANFDQGGGPMRLEVRLVYWFPMRIPFANWVMTKMFRAHFGIEDYVETNPIQVTQKTSEWTKGSNDIEPLIRGEYETRTNTPGTYVFPIVSSYSMRMMTPAKSDNFISPRCD